MKLCFLFFYYFYFHSPSFLLILGHIFFNRFVSLWLLNTTNDDVNGIVDLTSKGISSAKFVDLLYQLAARLVEKCEGPDGKRTLFPRVLFKLMVRCANDHPFHTLPVLLALVNANADQEEEQALASGKEIKCVLHSYSITFLDFFLTNSPFLLTASGRGNGQATGIH